MYKIVYSKKADFDLLEMIVHIEESSLQNALEYLDRYEKKIALLRLNPEMGTYCSNKKIQKNCRVLVFESHVIIYSIDPELNEIFIIRIFHHAVNYKGKV
jgi:plasmid stabilization system protein ParE